ncbi:MAG: Stp1/IreP family PP2C-type Ser/Thr phosphatase [Gemmatimonadota bacterium]|jgi:serine/threonine protein phosphatase PrpC
MNWIATGITDRGLRRPSNEDVFRVREDIGLFLVADGMGGHAAGDVASGIAAEVVERETSRALEAGAAPSAKLLAEAVEAAHRAIVDRSEAEPALSGMGTTLTAALVEADASLLHLAHVGDSRAYLLRDGELRRLTRDHTWVQQQVDTGRLSEAEARIHPGANVLLRALGGNAESVEVDTDQVPLSAGDLLLLCTDGLSGTVDDGDLLAILDRPLPLETIANQLVEAARLRGGPDNITAVLVRFAPSGQ